MPWRHPTADDFDRARDLAKVDREPRNALPLFEQTSAFTIAALIQGLPIDEAAELIDQYADAKAARIRLEAVAAGANA